jgi:APA family basic amino acid/polyamine antiporter
MPILSLKHKSSLITLDTFSENNPSMPTSPWIRKPLHTVQHKESDERTRLINPSQSSHSYQNIEPGGAVETTKKSTLERHLSLLDLVSIGIGGTVGSGLFVLCGLVAHDYAGPSSAISWALSGLAACVSGCCYAEMASRVPAAGSAYAYCFVSMGELPAVLAATCLTLEYVMAASAVARSWADKVVLYLSQEVQQGHWVNKYLDLDPISPLAFIITLASTLLLMNGVKESKAVTNFFTFTKCAIVAFMVIAGFFFLDTTNYKPFIPPGYGVAGVLRGSTATFFGYLGYDEVCCLAGEALNPKRNLPLAIMITLGSVTVLYIIATFSLTGMQSYDDISSVSGFPAAFQNVGAAWAAQISAWGELITLPVVVPLTIIGQPRLQYALAQDGLLPAFFADVDSGGNLFKGTVVAGALMVLTATCVPFDHLNDMISAAVLMALSMTDTALILLWHESPDDSPLLAESLMMVFHLAALVACIAFTHFAHTYVGAMISCTAPLIMIVSMMGLYWWCPKSDIFGGHRNRPKGYIRFDEGYFRTPFVPFWPCAGILINYYLTSQLEIIGLVGFLLVLLLATLYYCIHGVHHSVGNNGGWGPETDDMNGKSVELKRASIVRSITR